MLGGLVSAAVAKSEDLGCGRGNIPLGPVPGRHWPFQPTSFPWPRSWVGADVVGELIMIETKICENEPRTSSCARGFVVGSFIICRGS